MSTELIDYVGILTQHAIAAPRPNTKKNNALQFFALLAYPPEAFTALASLIGSAIGGDMDIRKIDHRVSPNSARSEPLPGIPADWLVFRAYTGGNYPPLIFDAQGKQLTPARTLDSVTGETSNDTDKALIQSLFYPGKPVRADVRVFPWVQDGKRGVSFTLKGIMATTQTPERLPIGAESRMVMSFGKYAEVASPATTAVPWDAPVVDQTGSFQPPYSSLESAPVAPRPVSNPFAVPTQSASPFNR